MQKTNLNSSSLAVQRIIKGLTLSKSLFVSTMVWGESHTGKQTLVHSIYPKLEFIDGRKIENLKDVLERSREICIYNFEAIQNVQSLNLENRRIVAIANYDKLPSSIENNFAFIYNIPPLRERLGDIQYFIKKFTKELQDELMIKDEIEIDTKYLDLSQNFKSLKISLHREFIKRTLSKQDIEEILFDYFYNKIEGKNSYREHISLYEKPLIQAGLKKFKSQLKLSEVLGLNRNTLRKKIYEHNIN
jgi:DNA-binding NtrC family response regulator